MAGLNAILTQIYTPVGTVAGTPPAGASQPLPRQSPNPAEEEKDRFQAGQPWLNRAAGGKETPAGTDCRCGSCAACGARVYATSQGKVQASSVSPAGRQEEGGEAAAGAAGDEQEQATENTQAAGSTGGSQVKGMDGQPLDPAEVARLGELKKADAAVRAHEQAHLAAAGGLAKGGASFAYQKGPDGRNYAVAGEVQIDTSKGTTPAETVAKMMRVRAAALAPANPSPQDRKVAQAAALTMSEARLELNTEKTRPAAEQQETREEAAEVDNGAGEGEKNTAGTTADSGKPAGAARAASRYLSAARGQGSWHLAV